MEYFPNRMLLIFLQLVEGLLDTVNAPMLTRMNEVTFKNNYELDQASTSTR